MNIDQDIVEEILVRLSAKSLLRFKSVCKSWYALIISSRFINQHHVLQRSIGNDRILFLKYSKERKDKYESLSRLLITPPEIEIPDFPYTGLSWRPFLAGEVNGIICITDTVRIYLMNPALREFRMLPTYDRTNGAEYKYGAKVVGFGFDESRNDYKVLKLDYKYNKIDAPSRSRIHYGAIYSLRNNSWRELWNIPLLKSNYLSFHDLPYLFFNGSLHWYAHSERDERGKEMIITFNMTTESFKKMQAPPLPEDDPENYHTCHTMLFVVDKSLMKFVSIIDVLDGYRRFLNIWVMKEYGVEDSWTKEYRIQVTSSIGKPLSFWKNDKLLFNTNVETELICYHLPTGQLHHVQQFDGSFFYKQSLGLVVFNESLVSINNID